MDFFYRYKSYYRQKGMSTPILDALIFKKMRSLVGGRIRLLLSGGAPLSPSTHDYVRNALSLPLVQGYGLTETCACGTIMDSDDNTVGRTGPPLQVSNYHCTPSLTESQQCPPFRDAKSSWWTGKRETTESLISRDLVVKLSLAVAMLVGALILYFCLIHSITFASLFKAHGYFKLEEKTKEDFFKDKNGQRWFRYFCQVFLNNNCMRLTDLVTD